MAFGARRAGKALIWCNHSSPHGRYPYSAITRRPDYHWPGKKRLAVYLGFNLEHFEFGSGLGAALGPKSPEPDVLNFSWRDYGNRVGAWRCLELFDSLKLPAGVILNTALYDYCPELIEACVKRGDELIGHGHTNSERQGEFSEEKERKLLQDCSDLIAKKSGKRPRGLAEPVDLGKPRHPRPAGRDRLPLHPQLVPRRPAATSSPRAAASSGRSPTRRS